jgi:phage gp45-like
MPKIFKIEGNALVIRENAVIIADVPKRSVYFINNDLVVNSKINIANVVFDLLTNCQDDNGGIPVTFTDASFRAFAYLNLG